MGTPQQRYPDVREESSVGRGETSYLRGGTLKFQQDQGAGTLDDVEVKQEGLVPGVGGGEWSW